jgi:pentatricopeptide repeat protein
MLSSVALACRRSRFSHNANILQARFRCSDRVLPSARGDSDNVMRHFSQVAANMSTDTHSTNNASSSPHGQETMLPNREGSGGYKSSTPHSDRTLSVESVILNLEKAAQYNQGERGGPSTKSLWNVDFVRTTVQQYEYCLKYFYHQHQNGGSSRGSERGPTIDVSPKVHSLFLSSETTEHALRAMLRCRVPTSLLSHKVREWERHIGTLGKTPLTDKLSLRMLEANGKAGNIGRAITLLSLRKSRNYSPQRSEFIFAITAIEAAGLYLRKNRNVFLSDKDQPSMDNPTRWLDAILLNMSQRDVPLTTEMANRMMNTYASTGKSGKALHYFYRVLRSPRDEDNDDDNEDYSDNQEPQEDASGHSARFQNRPVKVRLSMRPPPPYHKIPSQVRGKLVRKPGTTVRQLKLDRESDPDWSLPLTAAITFADSLTQGACGHDPIELNVISYSILIKACVNRGSLWRAMHIIDQVMPSNGVDPDVVAYNTLLGGLSKVGDVPTTREYFAQMLAKDIKPTKYTIEAIVNGLLNLGDVATAITVVQDCFNQYSILPPYTTQLKILEFALGRGLSYEAKRHVYFIQQLWKWERNDYHSEEFCKMMEMTKKHPKLSKEAMHKLFAYFGEQLEDSDFL